MQAARRTLFNKLVKRSFVRQVNTEHLVQHLDAKVLTALSAKHTTADWEKLIDTDATSVNDFVSELQGVIAQHKVMHHEYLTALSGGQYKGVMTEALYDYAVEFRQYSSRFAELISSVCNKLESEGFTKEAAKLNENLEEEQGNLDPADIKYLESIGMDPKWVDGVEHKILFDNFLDALKRRTPSHSQIKEDGGVVGREFAELVFGLTRGPHSSSATAVAAVGLATEDIVSPTYAFVNTAIKEHTTLNDYEGCFFPLHMDVDEQHAADLMNITKTLATTPKNRAVIVDSVSRVINQRCVVYDTLHARAQARVE